MACRGWDWWGRDEQLTIEKEKSGYSWLWRIDPSMFKKMGIRLSFWAYVAIICEKREIHSEISFQNSGLWSIFVWLLIHCFYCQIVLWLLSLQNNSLQGRIHYTQFEICLVMNPRFIKYRSLFLWLLGVE